MMHRGRRLLLFLLFFYLLGAEPGHFMLALCISYNLPRLFFLLFYSSSSCLFTLYFFLCLCSETFPAREIDAQTSL